MMNVEANDNEWISWLRKKPDKKSTELGGYLQGEQSDGG